MSIQYGGDKITFPDGSTVGSGWSGFKNRIINGAMMIDARNAGASVTPTSGSYTLDRWGVYCSAASKFTVQQNAGAVTPPVGFTKYAGVTSSSAYSIGASEIFGIAQCVEGYNIADLNWGSANAKAVTLSFWVRSSLTGQFGGFLKNGGVSVGGSNNRFYQFSYTISSANTWEYKTVTILGDTTGTWDSTNGPGLSVAFSLGAGSTYTGGSAAWGSTFYNQPSGSTNLVATNGATLYITGVQLEKGSTATSFDYRPYGTELALCQRYYEQIGGESTYQGTRWIGYGAASGGGELRIGFKQTKRTFPTCTKVGTWTVNNCAQPIIGTYNSNYMGLYTTITSTGGAFFYDTDTSTYVTVSAEL